MASIAVKAPPNADDWAQRPPSQRWAFLNTLDTLEDLASLVPEELRAAFMAFVRDAERCEELMARIDSDEAYRDLLDRALELELEGIRGVLRDHGGS